MGSSASDTFSDHALCPSQYNFKLGYYGVTFTRNIFDFSKTNTYYNEFDFIIETFDSPLTLSTTPSFPVNPCTDVEVNHACLNDGIAKTVSLPAGPSKTHYFTYSSEGTNSIVNTKY